MKKKTILAVLCVVLLLLFTSLSYGSDRPPSMPEINPGEPDLGDPWDHDKSSPGGEDENSDIVTIVIDLGFCYIFYTF